MGWVIEREGLYEHEGHVAYLTRDGRQAGATTGAGVLIPLPDADERVKAAHATPRAVTNDDMYETVPWGDVVAWQTKCSCGWTGQRWDRASTIPGEYGGRHPEDAHLPDGTTVDDAANADWMTHVEPMTRISAVQEAASEAAAARRRLDDAVAVARAGGASWTEIGQATGMTRQSAHERWGRVEQ